MNPTGIGCAERSGWWASLTGTALLLQSCQPNASSVLDRGGAEPTPTSNVRISDCFAADFPIVFSSAITPEFVPRVALRSADGSRGRLVSNAGKYYSPTWSPDGRALALRRRTGTETPSSVVLMALDGSEGVPLFMDESPSFGLTDVARPDGPTWAPDGESLAFASLQNSNTWAIWIISRSGGQLRRLLPDWEQPHFSPSWSRHDANQLLMVAESDGVQDIWLVDLSKSAPAENLTRALAAELRNARSPRWSPDGQSITFSAEPVSAEVAAASAPEEIYVLELAARQLIRVTFDAAIDVTPSWSPDGKRLLIASNRAAAPSAEASSLAARYLDLWVVSIDGSEAPVMLTRDQGINVEADWYQGSSCQGEP